MFLLFLAPDKIVLLFGVSGPMGVGGGGGGVGGGLFSFMYESKCFYWLVAHFHFTPFCFVQSMSKNKRIEEQRQITKKPASFYQLWLYGSTFVYYYWYVTFYLPIDLLNLEQVTDLLLTFQSTTMILCAGFFIHCPWIHGTELKTWIVILVLKCLDF